MSESSSEDDSQGPGHLAIPIPVPDDVWEQLKSEANLNDSIRGNVFLTGRQSTFYNCRAWAHKEVTRDTEIPDDYDIIVAESSERGMELKFDDPGKLAVELKWFSDAFTGEGKPGLRVTDANVTGSRLPDVVIMSKGNTDTSPVTHFFLKYDGPKPEGMPDDLYESKMSASERITHGLTDLEGSGFGNSVKKLYIG